MYETRTLASWIASNRIEIVPEGRLPRSARAIANYLGCALAGSRDEAVDIAIRAFGPYSGPPTARVLGRAERLDPLHASLMNGISSHVVRFR